jgi:hypothetical protein
VSLLMLSLGCLAVGERPEGTDLDGPWRWVGTASNTICGVNTARKMACVSSDSGQPIWRKLHKDFVQLDGVCGVTDDGEVSCLGAAFGDDGWIQDSPIGNRFVSVKLSADDAACAIRDDDSARCWAKDNISERISDQPESLVASVISSDFGGGITPDGELAVWGDSPSLNFFYNAPLTDIATDGTDMVFINDEDAWDLNSGSRIRRAGGIKLEAEAGTFCSMAESGMAMCWGEDDYGQAQQPDATFRDIDVSTNFACGVTDNQRIRCWGDAKSFPFE